MSLFLFFRVFLNDVEITCITVLLLFTFLSPIRAMQPHMESLPLSLQFFIPFTSVNAALMEEDLSRCTEQSAIL